MYPLVFKLFFSWMDAEAAHHLGFSMVRLFDRVPGVRTLLRRFCLPPRARAGRARVGALGLDFPSAFGLAAGFDKNGSGIRALGNLGFGAVEIGTVTAQAQPGNPKPRLFRLIPDRAVINRMGFNNVGAEAAAANLARAAKDLEALPPGDRPIIGVNIGKTKTVPLADAVADYVTSTRLLAPLADYLVLNVSSPNTPGLRDLQSVEALRPLILAVRETAAACVPSPRSTLGHVPLLVKIAPDLADEDLLAVADLALELKVDGLIATNTTIGREGLLSDPEAVAAAGAGGLSGSPLRERSLAVLRLLRERVGDRLTLVSVGGVSTPDDVVARLDAGAALVQGYTAFLYEGPFWARGIVRALARRAPANEGVRS